jgi:hypothetical protein
VGARGRQKELTRSFRLFDLHDEARDQILLFGVIMGELDDWDESGGKSMASREINRRRSDPLRFSIFFFSTFIFLPE